MRAHAAPTRRASPSCCPSIGRRSAQIAQWPKALADSLARLTNLRPFAKKVLIEGLVHCIAHDQKLSVEEGELLRTVCAVLHCPLPPILAPHPQPGS